MARTTDRIGGTDDRGYVPVYYGATSSPSGAMRVTVGVSQQVSAVDIQLQFVKTSTIAGTVVNLDGSPASARLQLIDPLMPIANLGVWFRDAAGGGRFSFAGLSPGSYVINAQGMGTAASGGATATLTVPVDTEPVEVTLTLRRGVTVAGVLDLPTLKAPADARKIRVNLEPVTTAADWEVTSHQDAPDADGRFAFRGVPPGKYRVTVTGLPSGWSLDSAVFGGHDAADVPLQVEGGENIGGGLLKLTVQTGEIAGAVSTTAGVPAPDRTVVVFPADRAHWVPSSRRIHVAQPGHDGRFEFRGLPAGEYRLAAVDAVEAGQQFDVAFLAELVAEATAATLSAGGKVTAAVRAR